MEYVYGALGFIVLVGLLNWYRTKKNNEKKRREELYTVTVAELIAALKKCDPDREVIVADLRYANYDLDSGENLLRDLIWPEE